MDTKKDIFNWDWTTCLKYANHSRVNIQHDWEDLCDHSMSRIIFTLNMHKIFTWSPNYELMSQLSPHCPLNMLFMADHFETLEWWLRQHPCALAVHHFQNYITNIGRRDQPVVSGAVPNLYWPCVWTICNVPLHLLYPIPTYKGNPNILTKFKHQQLVHYVYLECFKLKFCCIYLTIGLPTSYYVFQAKLQYLWTSLVRTTTTTWRHISW